jgi:hypothetical protein
MLSREPADLSWFPRMACMSLAKDDGEDEADRMVSLRAELGETTSIVHVLVDQLNQLQQNLVEQRKVSQRTDMEMQRRALRSQRAGQDATA